MQIFFRQSSYEFLISEVESLKLQIEYINLNVRLRSCILKNKSFDRNSKYFAGVSCNSTNDDFISRKMPC